MAIICLIVCGGGFIWCEKEGIGIRDEIGLDGKLKHITVDDVDADMGKGILFWGVIISLLILIFT